MKIKDVVTLVTQSMSPKPNTKYYLYSLPSFDNQHTREIILGSDIHSNKLVVPDKCILFNKLNVRFKRIWAVESLEENKICSTEFLPLVVDENKIDFFYCFYMLQSNGITNYLCGQNANTSGSHKRIDPNVFLNISIQLPILSEQQKIGHLLSTIDKLISIKHEENAQLEALAKQIYDYWFVQFDFPNDEGKPYKSSGGKMVWNETLKREIPDGWSEAPLSSISSVENGATPSTLEEDNYGGNIGWITPKDLSNKRAKFFAKGERSITQKGYDSCSTTLLPAGSILMSSRAPIGLVAIASDEVCTNQGFKNIVPNEINDRFFLFYYIKKYMPFIEAMGNGTTFKEVSKDSLLSFPIMKVNNTNVHRKWVQIAKNIFEKQKKLEMETDELQFLRDYLLPLLMNGQVTIKD